jgi:hypothetical protein
MYGQNAAQYQDWVAEEWVGDQGHGLPSHLSAAQMPEGEDPARDRDAMPHWTKEEWVGDQGHGLPRHLSAAQMPEGERGLSGFRHTGPAAHWAPSY